MRRGAVRMRAGLAVALLLPVLLPACAAPVGDGASRGTARRAMPSRIVSMNPCVDAILEEVADPASIAAISHYSHDPRAASVRPDWARRFPAVSDAAEDVVAARPDLVISGPHVAPQTSAALERLGITLLKVGVPATVEESEAQVMQIADRIGRSAQGRALAARIDHAMAQARASVAVSDTRPAALIWQDSGLAPGEGTLADDLLARTGFASASRRMGLAQWDMVTLEQIISSPPDIMLTGEAVMETGTGGSANRMLSHPVIGHLRGRMMVADFPASLLHCGGPVIIRTAARLSEVRREWDGRKRAGGPKT